MEHLEAGRLNAASDQAHAALMGLADQVNALRVRLICGGTPAEMAEDLAREYFLWALAATGAAGEAD